jgi:hypothetical protein
MAETLLFKGDGTDDDTAQNFMRKFLQRNPFTGTNGKTLVRTFRNYLDGDGEAEEWYESVKEEQKEKWDSFEVAWNERFPPVKRTAKKKADYEKELLELKVAAKDMCGTVKKMGRDVPVVEDWANEALRLAKQVGIADSSLLIGKVREGLPDAIKQKVENTHKDWASFCAAVKNIDQTYLRESVERAEREERLEREVAQLVQSVRQRPSVQDSPTKGIRSQLGNFSFQRDTSPSPTPYRSRPYVPARGLGTRGGGLTTRRRYVSAEEAARIAAAVQIHPNTAEGKEAYEREVRQWEAQNGQSGVSALAPFPLRPGSAPLGSEECYTCGTVGHRGAECTNPPAPEREQRTRALFSAILRRAGAAPVNFVGTEEVLWLPEERSGSGNGGELVA